MNWNSIIIIGQVIIIINIQFMCHLSNAAATTTVTKSSITASADAVSIDSRSTTLISTTTSSSTLKITKKPILNNNSKLINKNNNSTGLNLDPLTIDGKHQLTLERTPPPKRAVSTNDILLIKQQKSINSIQNVNQIELTTTTKLNQPKSIRGTAPADLYECPKLETFVLFPTICKKHGECIKNQGSDYRCCKEFGSKRCVKAKARPIPEPKHEPLLGLIPRKCPKEPLAELFWNLQTCDTDNDCWPRICCPDGILKYCRTSTPQLAKLSLPVARQLSTQSISKYIQCTPPPPAAYDKFPKKCNTTLDCFPNVCCQEEGLKHCRPPQKSLLALFTGLATRINTGLIRQWTQNLVIK